MTGAAHDCLRSSVQGTKVLHIERFFKQKTKLVIADKEFPVTMMSST